MNPRIFIAARDRLSKVSRSSLSAPTTHGFRHAPSKTLGAMLGGNGDTIFGWENCSTGIEGDIPARVAQCAPSGHRHL